LTGEPWIFGMNSQYWERYGVHNTKFLVSLVKNVVLKYAINRLFKWVSLALSATRTHYSSWIVTLLWMSQQWMNIGDQWSLLQACRQERPCSKNECRLGALCWPLLAYLISEIDSAWVQGRWQTLPYVGHQFQCAPCRVFELRESIATGSMLWSRKCRNSLIRTYKRTYKS
jgi:hypothetical protein